MPLVPDRHSASETLRQLVENPDSSEFLTEQIRVVGEWQEFAFLTSAYVILLMMFKQVPHFENHRPLEK